MLIKWTSYLGIYLLPFTLFDIFIIGLNNIIKTKHIISKEDKLTMHMTTP